MQVELYVIHIGVNMVYGCPIYQDLGDGMWEVPEKCRGRESEVVYDDLPCQPHLVLPQRETL